MANPMDRILPSTGDFYSVPEITDPSKLTDDELVRLYARFGFFRSPELKRDRLGPLSRPRLPQCFLADEVLFSAGWETDCGTWKPKKVSTVGNMLGVKTTLEFKPNNGVKVDIGQMAVYSSLSPYRDGFFLEENSSLCCVFSKGKGPAPHPCNGFVPLPPLHEWIEVIRTDYDTTVSHPLGVEDYGVGGPKKRQRGGGWDGYTKIYTKDADRMYAACNLCPTMLKVKPGSGTGSQSHHNKTCLFKNLPTMNSMNTPSTDLGAGSSGVSDLTSTHFGLTLD